MKTLTETMAAVRTALPETVRAHRSGCRVFVKAYSADELRPVLASVTAALTDAGREPRRLAIRGYSIGRDDRGNATACWRILETAEEHRIYLGGGDTVAGAT